MINTQLKSDKLAIMLSTICVIHCFFFPSLIILSAGFLTLSLESELIHSLILLLTLPISIFALASGYENHKTITFLLIGIFGLTTLVAAILLGGSFFGEPGEKGLTLIGSILVAYAHFNNYQICIKTDCSCHDK